MPFQKIYAADFRSSGRFPTLNPNLWPPLQITTDSDNTNHEWTGQGLILEIAKTDDTIVRNCVYVVPPEGISMNSRLFMKVTFDHPYGIGRWVTRTRADMKKKTETAKLKSKSESRLISDTSLPLTDLEVDPFNQDPEPWAVTLGYSSVDHFSERDKTVIVGCQFHRKESASGIKLTAPLALQIDEPAYLETPLDYQQYQDKDPINPNPQPGDENFYAKPAPEFTLVHSFSGRDLLTTNHTTGAGYLKITRNDQSELIDHRVYSHNAIADVNSSPRIQALGILLVTIRGFGWMRVRLLTFEIWWDINSDPLIPSVIMGGVIRN